MLATDEQVEQLKKMCNDLLTKEQPKIEIEVAETLHKLEGSEARSFGCGLKVALDVLI